MLLEKPIPVGRKEAFAADLLIPRRAPIKKPVNKKRGVANVFSLSWSYAHGKACAGRSLATHSVP